MLKPPPARTGRAAPMTTPAWQALETEFRGLWPTRVDTFFDDTYLDSFLHRLWTESLGFGGPCCWGVN